MEAPLKDCTTLEQRAVIRFLNAEGIQTSQICQRMKNIYEGAGVEDRAVDLLVTDEVGPGLAPVPTLPTTEALIAAVAPQVDLSKGHILAQLAPERRTSYSYNLSCHKRNRHSDVRLKCKLCKYVGSEETDLRNHICKEKFCCGKCEYKTYFKSYLSRHQQVHNTVLYSCPQCGSKCKFKNNIKKHMKKKHNVQNINVEDFVTPGTMSLDKLITPPIQKSGVMKWTGLKDGLVNCMKQKPEFFTSRRYISVQIHTIADYHTATKWLEDRHYTFHFKILDDVKRLEWSSELSTIASLSPKYKRTWKTRDLSCPKLRDYENQQQRRSSH
ncbi:hypothetical protein LAZ67_3005506 [Cordylochernes scorpioides]|uniref:C2H2-type domain-containing protein n=1 Tax=Cordylochernes scorpioides TaxID=51811 RepID=A0ABY6KDT9_9ARAC|nr:hypothetical protein LAZ67_3005506 [Cordylochernes scorpioides]